MLLKLLVEDLFHDLQNPITSLRNVFLITLLQITSLSKKTVCFAMFLDEVTLHTLESEGQKMDSMGFIGIWKIILIKNMPYNDMRRVGKIPKFLAHRLFPSSR